jgi:LPXTG-motif cell wall-anchored protein
LLMKRYAPYVAGVALAGLATWVFLKRRRDLEDVGRNAVSPVPFIEIDDDAAADIIKRFVPAIDSGLRMARIVP